MTSIYQEPEKFGLKTIGEVDYSSGCYEFDYTVVWQDTETGSLWFADDSGCSCPSPFESAGRNTLTKIDRLQTLIDHLDKRYQDRDFYDCEDEPSSDRARITNQIADLIKKVGAA